MTHFFFLVAMETKKNKQTKKKKRKKRKREKHYWYNLFNLNEPRFRQAVCSPSQPIIFVPVMKLKFLKIDVQATSLEKEKKISCHLKDIFFSRRF